MGVGVSRRHVFLDSQNFGNEFVILEPIINVSPRLRKSKHSPRHVPIPSSPLGALRRSVICVGHRHSQFIVSACTVPEIIS